MSKDGKSNAEICKYDAAIITGASSGIGEEFAARILSAAKSAGKQLRVFNISRTPTKFESSPNFASIDCDLSDSAELEKAAARIKRSLSAIFAGKTPRILLINNAGFGAYGEFPSPSLERNLKVTDLNVRALTALCAEFLPEIAAQKGAIINMASTAAFQPCPRLSVYAATKAYVKSLSLSLAYEMRKSGAKCLCVCPGPTSSMFYKAAGFDSAPMPSWFGHKPHHVVDAAFNALSKNRPIVVVGVLNKLQTVLVRLIPEKTLLHISGFILDKIR